MKITLFDIPTYRVALDPRLHKLLRYRLAVQHQELQRANGQPLVLPALNYSRGLLLLATALKQAGHQVFYIVATDEADMFRFPDVVKQSSILCITCMTPTLHYANVIAEQAKKINSVITVILGGPHAEAIPESTLLDCSSVDAVYYGRSLLLPRQVVDLIGQPDLMPNTLWRSTSQDPKRDSGEGLESTSEQAPDFSLLSKGVDAYAHNLMASKGCTQHCRFCSEGSAKRRTYEEISLDMVEAELAYLHERCHYNTLIHFADAVFTMDYGRTEELCAILSRFPKFAYAIDTRVDHVGDQTIAALGSIRVAMVRLGLETSDGQRLAALSKNITWNQIRSACARLKIGLPNALTYAYWITGLPNTTRSQLKDEQQFVTELILSGTVDLVSNKILVPYPGTDLFHYPAQYGMKIATLEWEKYDRLSLPVYETTELSSNEIFEAFIRVETGIVDAYGQRYSCPQQLAFSDYKATCYT